MTEPKSARERFEAWAIAEGLDLITHEVMTGTYLVNETAYAWGAWQAAERSAIERAENEARRLYNDTGDNIAQAIRSLLT